MLKRIACLLTLLAGVACAADAPKQPVLIILYSRFYDHTHQRTTDERIQRLLPMLEKLRNQYPQSGVSALLQFSGAVTEVLAEQNGGLHLVDKLKDSSNRGLVEIGYTGEEEPSYLYRPKPDLLNAETPEQRWAARYDAGWRFLNDFKNPITGMPVPGLTGGLRKTLDILGSAVFATGLTAKLGAEAPTVHALRKMDPGALMGGIRPSDVRFGIEGYSSSSSSFSMAISPDPQESPEVFWGDNVLRVSDVSLADHRPHSADEKVAELKTIFDRLDRGHVRVIKLEIASYLRYLNKRVDGSVAFDPMEWLYYHPEDPVMPPTVKSLAEANVVEAAYQNEEATLKWLLGEFLPANPGSRIVSVRELARMAAPTDSDVTAGEIKALAADIDNQFVKRPMMAPNFGRAGNRFFSLAEAYGVLSQAVAGIEKSHAIPDKVTLIPVYGPLQIPDASMGVSSAAIKESDVVKVAAELAPRFTHEDWKLVPDNAVPLNVEAGGVKLNAAQFLRLMAQVCLDPNPDKVLYVNGVIMFSNTAFLYPKNTPMIYQSDAWTFKPAPLAIGVSGLSAVARR